MADNFRFEGGASTPSNSSGSIAREKRKLFTVVFVVWAPNIEFFVRSSYFPGTLKLVVGHVATTVPCGLAGSAGSLWNVGGGAQGV